MQRGDFTVVHAVLGSREDLPQCALVALMIAPRDKSVRGHADRFRRRPAQETLGARVPGGDSAVDVLLRKDKLLSVGQADRDHHPSASLELVNQGSWDQIGRRRDHHRY